MGSSSLASVTISAGQASGSDTLKVTPTSDAVVEGDETIVVSGSVTGFSVAEATSPAGGPGGTPRKCIDHRSLGERGGGEQRHLYGDSVQSGGQAGESGLVGYGGYCVGS